MDTKAIRRYMQGTLDYHCGIYCVINALSCMNKVDLGTARTVLNETILDIAKNSNLFESFMRNRSNHFWVVAYTLARWTQCGQMKLTCEQPFSPIWLPDSEAPAEELLKDPVLFWPESKQEGDTPEKIEETWNKLKEWLKPNMSGPTKKTAILRFHRYLPGIETPIISHWSTAHSLMEETLYLHDASSEVNALHSIRRDNLNMNEKGQVPVRIVPESIILLKSPEQYLMC